MTMATAVVSRMAVLTLICGQLVACGQPAAPARTVEASPDSNGLSISFKVEPDPPQTGDNDLLVSLAQSGGPVADATVTAVFYMPAMPSMGMPEMRSSFQLQPVGGGVYRGNGNLIMGGTWTVTVNVSRAGESLGSRKFTVIAK